MLTAEQRQQLLLLLTRPKTASKGILPQSWAQYTDPVVNALGGSYDWVKNNVLPPITEAGNTVRAVQDMAVPVGTGLAATAGLAALLQRNYRQGGTTGVLDAVMHGDKQSKLLMNAGLPAALGTGAGFLMPSDREPGESGKSYKRRKRNRAALGALLGGGAGLAFHTLANAKR